MKKLPAITALALALISGLAQADRLEDIRKAGVLRVASFDSNPPFGFVDAKSKQIEGLDVDYAKALADKLGVRLQVLPTNPANRIPLLTANKVDLVLANFTITPERAQQVDFSIPYFSSGQQFIVKKGTLTSPEVLNKWRVGVDKGTVNEGVLREVPRRQGHRLRRHALRFHRPAQRPGPGHHPGRSEADRPAGQRARPRQVRSAALHHFQRPDRRRYSQGRSP